MGKFITPNGDRKFFKGKGRKRDIDLNDREDNYQEKVLQNLEKKMGIRPEKRRKKEDWEEETPKEPEYIPSGPVLTPKPFTKKIRIVKKDGTVIETTAP